MSRVQRALALAGMAALSACVRSEQAECMPGHALCGGECVEIGTDARNCGACGRACPAAQACTRGACAATCESMLHAPIRDEWGYHWDGLERPSAPYQTARDACASLGGRLPSVSEMYRVSAEKGGAVGDLHKTNVLWAITPYNDTYAYAMTMANIGAAFSGAGYYAMSGARPYRCVCPPPRPAAFSEGACYGPAGSGCAALGGDPRFNFDREDRPYLGKSGAIFECALAGGELASAERLGAAVTQGLPNGTGVWLHTGEDDGHYGDDNGDYEDDVCLQFTGPSSWGVTYGGAYWAYYPRPFRCFGPASASAVPATVSNGFRDRRGERTIDLGPDFAATTYTSAVADCLRRGGHLPTITELVHLVEQGLPAFAYADRRWTADQGYPGYAVTFSWTGSSAWPDAELAVTAPTRDGVPYHWSAASVADHPLNHAVGLPYRCVYYAVDPTYRAPVDNTQCSGACFAVTPGTGTATPQPRIWFDGSTRVGASYYAAVATCAANGGRLASARDLLEAIRSRLDNAGAAIGTSDLVGFLGVRTLTGWSGTGNTEFTDTGNSSIGLGASINYRCMWTNEIR